MFLLSPFARRVQASFLSILLFAATLFPSAVLIADEVSAPASPEEQMAAMDDYFREMRRFRDTLPDDQYDPAALIRSLGNDPQVLLDWVKENTVQVPYPGRLRSPAAVMMDGTGNALDRAVLLAHLLRLAGHTVQLASASVEPTPAPAAPLRGEWFPPVLEIPAELNDPEALAFFSGAVSLHERRLESMAGRLAVQIPALQAFAAEHGAPAPQGPAGEERHWWVLLENGEALDPAGHKGLEAEHRFGLGELEDALYHSVTVEVRVERLERGRFVEETALSHSFRPAQYTHPSFVLGFMADEVHLTFSLADELGQNFPNEVRSQMTRASNWVPYFELGEEQIAQKAFDDKGLLNENHLQIAQGRAVTDAAGLLGGLGVGRGGAARAPESMLSAVDLAFVWSFPDGSTREVTRRVYDLLPEDPARTHTRNALPTLSDEQKLARGLALSHHSEVLVQTGFMPRIFATAMQVDSVLRNRQAVMGALHFQTRGDMNRIQSSLENMRSFPEPLYDWAVHRSEMNPALGSVFLPETHLIAWHNRFIPGPDGAPALKRGYDILGNRVNPVDGEHEAVLVQGVVDAVVESALAERQGQPSVSTSALMEKNGAETWVTLKSAEEVAALGLSPGVEHMLQTALQSGKVLLVPDELADLPESEAAWWEFDPASGAVMARIADGGWGGFGEYLLSLFTAKAQIGLLAFSVLMCYDSPTIGCAICALLGAAIIVLGFVATGPGVVAFGALAGGKINLGCGIASAMGH
jgi:hypothetical protein